MGIELERKAYQKLLDWKRESNGRSALLVNGMRRVGKTHLLERFGRSEYRSCLFVRFGEADPGLIDIFCHDSIDRFNLMFGKRLGRSYVLCTKDLSVEGNMVFLPLYMAFLL